MASVLFSGSQIVYRGKINYEINFVIQCIISGVIYYISAVCAIIAIRGVCLNKTIPLNYIPLVMSTILGVVILGESVFYTDVIGTLLICGYNVYDIVYPDRN
jgi:uncharacterized membrane protein